MKTIRVSEATNTQLDWLVAKCEGHDVGFDACGVTIQRSRGTDRFDPTTNPGWMWPIIDREIIATRPAYLVGTSESGAEINQQCGWIAHPPSKHYWQTPMQASHGATGLIAAARCYVVSKLGKTVEVPDELACPSRH